MGGLMSKPPAAALNTALTAEAAGLVPSAASVRATVLGGSGHGLDLPVPQLDSGVFANPAKWNFAEQGFGQARQQSPSQVDFQDGADRLRT